ncbi:DNA polymerase thumb domain-containing protein, partial [Mycobacterium avium]
MGDQSVDALTGIGPVTSSRLADLGITTVAQMARADQELLKSTFGPQQGRYLWLLANGGGVDVTTTTSATQQQASSA